ncbi:MAG: hypothetical protein RLZZ458_3102 [Planctomycetota bacterium]|jgi:hypothetical protein
MLRQIFAACCVLAAACGTANAGDRIFLHHGGMYVHSPVYVHPAYAVPVAPVVYSAPVWHYPAPVVVHPVAVAPAPVYYSPYYAPAVVPAPVYYYRGHRGFRPYRGVEIEFERDGDIEIDYR